MNDVGPLYAGLDPGVQGGMALLDAEAQFAVAYPWPDTERDLADLLAQYAPHIRMAWLERVHAFPKQGVVSTFTFGRSYGLLRGLLIGLKIPFEDIAPTKWTRVLGLKGKGRRQTRKALHKSWAQQWFPALEITMRTCDAILIAEYGRRQRGAEKAAPVGELVR